MARLLRTYEPAEVLLTPSLNLLIVDFLRSVSRGDQDVFDRAGELNPKASAQRFLKLRHCLVAACAPPPVSAYLHLIGMADCSPLCMPIPLLFLAPD